MPRPRANSAKPPAVSHRAPSRFSSSAANGAVTNWATPVTSTTGYAFAAIFYLIFCYGMSRYARFVEARLAAGDSLLHGRHFARHERGGAPEGFRRVVHHHYAV